MLEWLDWNCICLRNKNEKFFSLRMTLDEQTDSQLPEFSPDSMRPASSPSSSLRSKFPKHHHLAIPKPSPKSQIQPDIFQPLPHEPSVCTLIILGLTLTPSNSALFPASPCKSLSNSISALLLSRLVLLCLLTSLFSFPSAPLPTFLRPGSGLNNLPSGGASTTRYWGRALSSLSSGCTSPVRSAISPLFSIGASTSPGLYGGACDDWEKLRSGISRSDCWNGGVCGSSDGWLFSCATGSYDDEVHLVLAN